MPRIFDNIEDKLRSVLQRTLSLSDRADFCRRYFKVRPPGGSTHPEQTDTKYCIYDKRHNDYGYTEEWVNLLIEKFKDEEAYEEIYAKSRGTEA